MKITARNDSIAHKWKDEIRQIEIRLRAKVFSSVDRLILWDQHAEFTNEKILELKSQGMAPVLVFDSTQDVHSKILEDSFDLSPWTAVLTYPFQETEIVNVARLLEMESAAKNLTPWVEKIKQMNASLASVNGMLERFQKTHTPNRFEGLKGFRIQARHISGLKPGGDFFDIFESPKKDFTYLLMADSSNYGISSAFLGMLLNTGAKIAADTGTPVSKWVRALHRELAVALGDSGTLSLFLAKIQKRNFVMEYESFGTCEAYIVSQGGTCTRLKKSGPRLTGNENTSDGSESALFEVALRPKDRLVMLSDGFIHAMGGEAKLQSTFQKKLAQDPFDLINDLAFEVKSKIDRQAGTFPGEDCTAIVLDVDGRVLRIASGE